MPNAHHAIGIEYRELMPGFFAFDCNPLRATISPTSCADRWSKSECGSSCHGCSVGAQHAGRPDAPTPPTRMPCCRCGRTDQRLLAKTLCVSCFNRQRETIKGRNSKGDFPMHASAKLRWGFAIVSHPSTATALAKMNERHRPKGASWSSGLKGQYLPGLPAIEVLDEQNAWLAAVVTGREELEMIVARLLPNGVIEDAEFSATFAEQHFSVNNTNICMSA